MTARPILIIEDEHALGTALEMLVRRMGHLPTLVASGAAGLAEFRRQAYAAVVLDIGLPDISGLQVLEQLRQQGSDVPVLVITAHATLDHAIHAQKSGGTGYLTKPLDLGTFERTLGAMLAPGVRLPAPSGRVGEPRSVTLIGAAPCLRDAFIGIARACAGELPVLISGPSGAGKTLAATVIHAHGTRAHQPLVFMPALDLTDPSALPAGTVVLEEVADLAPAVQSALAAWLAAPQSAGPRVLATTVHDPLTAVREGRLREDLFYSLATLSIPLPPLRERSGDIPALAAFFVGVCGDRPAPVLTPPVLAVLQAYPWPGNVRELRHVLDYAVTVSGGGPVFLSHLPAHLATAAAESAVSPGELDAVIGRWLDAALAEPEPPAYDELLDRLENAVLRHLMARHEHKPTHLAAALRIHRATLRQKLRRAGLQRGDE